VATINLPVRLSADEVNTTDLSSWKLNGQPVIAINKFVTEADACDHHVKELSASASAYVGSYQRSEIY
jgi:hypothetical protein